jgi:hypothetical protein
MMWAGSMCRRAMRVAMRRISCMDQRINGRDDSGGGVWADSFFGVLRHSSDGG